MIKKRHQDIPNGDISSGSADENQNNVECSHISKSVDLQKVKKRLTRTGFLTKCETCDKSPPDPDMLDMEFDTSLWLCLKCGNQACGRGLNQHALKHYESPHSDSHAMCVNTTVWSIWCYGCDDEVNLTCKKKLQEAVEHFRKQAETNRIKQKPFMPQIAENASDIIPLPPPNNTGTTPKILLTHTSGLQRARGLTNLGNTCFFNSVMQCLGQTPYLLQLLEDTSKEGQYFQLPGGEMKGDNNEILKLEPIDGILEKWKPLTASLAETLRELQTGRNEVYNPRLLFSRLTDKMPQFGGGDQHDSHELLRHLLEGVREGDFKRYKIVILNKFGLTTKTDPKTVEEDTKKIVKFYGQQASEMLLPTEQVFRGVLVRTLQCQDCGHTSHLEEYFLDISLPISEKQLPPVLRRKAEDIEDNKPSKHQMKKEKKAQRKKNRKFKNQKNILNNEILFNSNNNNNINNNQSESESDADVEDNLEEASSKNRTLEKIAKGTESGYNSDKVENSSPESNVESSPGCRVTNSSVLSPIINVEKMSSGSPENSPASSDTNLESCSSSSLVCENASGNEDVFCAEGEIKRPESRLAFVKNKNNDLKVNLEKLSLLNDGDPSKLNNLIQDEEMHEEGACGPVEVEDEKMEEDDCLEEENCAEEDESFWSGTLSPRYQCEEGECSIQSCLNQFTECELMAGNNKVVCEMCSKRFGGPDKKVVNTDASLQFLIYNPPAVLILHLKRFQVLRFRAAKVSKYVKFSTILDLAPFCQKRSQNLPTFHAGQNKVLYSLYGVVEHSGSIHGGHYVAYVKVRSPLEENSYRWQFLPKNQKGKMDCSQEAPVGEPEVPSGKWYYISDSYVSEVQESRVLAAQAYLLFYERIM